MIGTSSPANHEYLRSLGAEPITYREALVARARALAADGAENVLTITDFAGVRVAPEAPRHPCVSR